MGRKNHGVSTGSQMLGAILSSDDSLKRAVNELRDEMSKRAFGIKISFASTVCYACEVALKQIRESGK